MAKSSRQKLKILYITKALQERSDEKHPMSVRDLIQYLQGVGIVAERKAIYDDIDTLRTFGLEIESRRKKPSGFYLQRREFTTEELRLIADALHAVPFVSAQKTGELIGKLEKLTSQSDRKKIDSGYSESKTISALDEQVYDIIDCIEQSMEQNVQISFVYVEWTVEKKLEPKKGGARYQVSPWGIIRKDGSYYMIGIDEKSHIVKHYRIDKMREIRKEALTRTGHEIFENFDAGEFASRTFGMFGGREETVTVRFENHYIGVLIERFGGDVRIVSSDPEHFHAFLRIHVSRQFYGWLAGLGSGVEILSPETTRTEYQKFLKKALESYQ